jgi:hypothetical protein
MDVVHHWWDGSWSPPYRRDVFVRTDGQVYEVEIRQGGYFGRTARARFSTLADAVAEARRHLLPDVPWKDIAAAHQIIRRGQAPGEAVSPAAANPDGA